MGQMPRMELAKGWLRCGHSADQIAQAFQFPSCWHFQCEFAAFTKKSCAAVSSEEPLQNLEPAALAEVMRPFWWPKPGELLFRFEIPPITPKPWTDEDTKELMRDLESRPALSDPFALHPPAPENKPDQENGSALHGKSTEFFAMRSTGAEIIVPIFTALPGAAAA